MSQYDFLIVGAGLYGATFARLATDGGPCVAVDEEGVWHLDLGQQHLIQLDGATGVGRGRR